MVCAALPTSTARAAVVRSRQHADRRMRAARAAAEEAARTPAERVLRTRQETGLVERGDVIGMLAGNGMDQAVVAIATRQQRRRAFVAETLVGGAVRRPRRAHAGDEQGLAVVVFLDADAERVAHAAAGAIGGDQQLCAQHAFAIAVGRAHRRTRTRSRAVAGARPRKRTGR